MKRAVSQDDWKRTQLRMPVEEYERILKYAESHKISINTAILRLVDNALALEESSQNTQPKPSTPLTLKEVRELMDSFITPQHRELLNKIEQIQKNIPKFDI